jgi:hypothetical protein
MRIAFPVDCGAENLRGIANPNLLRLCHGGEALPKNAQHLIRCHNAELGTKGTIVREANRYDDATLMAPLCVIGNKRHFPIELMARAVSHLNESYGRAKSSHWSCESRPLCELSLPRLPAPNHAKARAGESQVHPKRRHSPLTKASGFTQTFSASPLWTSPPAALYCRSQYWSGGTQ